MSKNLLTGNKKGPTELEVAIKDLRTGFVGVGITSFFMNLLMLATPLYMLSIYGRVLTSGHRDTLLFLTLVTLFALLILGSLYAIRGWLLSRISGWLSARLGGRILTACVSGVIGGSQSSTVPLRDLRQLQSFISNGVAVLFDAPWVPIFIGVIWLMHPLMGSLALAGAICLFALACINEFALRDRQKRVNQQQNSAMFFADSALQNSEVIQAMGMQGNLVKRWYNIATGALEDQDAVSSRSAVIMGISRFLRMSLQVGVLGIGAYLVLEGELTAGHMIAGSILMGRALAPVEQAMGAWTNFIQTRNSYGRLQELLTAIPAPPDVMNIPPPKGRVEVDKLSFKLRDNDRLILQNVSFDLQPGETLALVGPSASGKSTLCRMLVGVYQPTLGSVRLDGVEVHTWGRYDFGQYVGYLPQDVELFVGTIKQNIARMAEDASDESVVQAAQRAGAHEMILHLPDGYNTMLGPGGAALSAGQRQRVGLARAMYGNPKLLVLDEPNSNLDQFAEANLIRTLQSLKTDGVTIVVVAHQVRILKSADKILKLNEGKVEAYGSPSNRTPQTENALPGGVTGTTFNNPLK